ncbi:YggT family protein [Cognatazoarcus halotolerans]|uniref:YggT family protein n=1 Tax=Cognatazoarcus halotolerans TaxID=2686016 RepID=UPI001359701B|nr:YggT family protein [Cognatazoarcus halotolerans]MBX3680071.1 YggT family protein [Rhodocyclaceae bacterium]MCB1899254.1 YggT family protein [Rhodocyclaceae bacterium]MCP5308277.1 YggT family protein [Zoogloeaceae bacterium]
MLTSLLLLILNAAASFLTLMLLARFFMQWQRVSFRNQLGQFILATTDWLVLPLRRVVPGLFGLDIASLLPAWAVQTLMVFIEFALRGIDLGGNPLGALLGVWGIGLVELMRMMVYLLMGVVLASAILSWVNPYAPMAPIINALAEPFLRPIRQVVPMIANVDLSPLVLLLVLQVVLVLLGSLQGAFLPLLVR